VQNIGGANDFHGTLFLQSKNIGGAKCYFFPYFKNYCTPTSTGPDDCDKKNKSEKTEIQKPKSK